jgi:hypothetical protein
LAVQCSSETNIVKFIKITLALPPNPHYNSHILKQRRYITMKKDYSHIRKGMYVLKEDIKNEATWKAVTKAFSKAGADLWIAPDCYDEFLLGNSECYGWDIEGDLYLHDAVLVTGASLWCTKLVSVDFILNGVNKEEENDNTMFKVGEVYKCGDVEVKIVYVTESGEQVVGIEFEDGIECPYVGLWDSHTGGYDSDNQGDLTCDLKPIKDNTETLKEIGELKERIKQLEESL